MAYSGFNRVQSNEELNREHAEREAREHPPTAPPHIEKLAEYIRKCFDDAKMHRARSIDPRLLDCQRRYQGEYAPARMAEIDKRGGSKLYFNITATKCGALQARLSDIVRPYDDRSFGLEPTPISDLPEDVQTRIAEQATVQFEAAVNDITARREQAASMGVDDPVAEADWENLKKDVQTWALQVYDEAKKESEKEAERRAERMAKKMADQMAEGGWAQALADNIKYLSIYPYAIIKGPVLTTRQRVKWEGKEPTVTDEIIPTWESVNPFDYYFEPNIRKPNDGYCCQSVTITRAELSKFRGVPGYVTEAIDAVLLEGDGKGDDATDEFDSDAEPERATLEERDTSINSGTARSSVKGVEFWGWVQGKLLKDWGMKVEDDNKFYAITALLIGDYVIRAITNPDKLGRVPFFITSYRKTPNSIVGEGLPEVMADCQDAVNGACRNAMDNLAMASGPMGAADMNAIKVAPGQDPTDVRPWKIWQYDGRQTNGKSPITWFQPTSNVDELHRVAEYYAQQADDRTLIPRYAHGNENVSGAAETLGGLERLMAEADKGTKLVLANMDMDQLGPAAEYLYRWDLFNLKDDEWDACKGDVRIVPRGVLSVIVREEQLRRQQEVLQLTNNAADREIIPVEGRAVLLRAIVSRLGVPADEVVPSTEKLEQILQERQEMEMAAQEQAAIAQPQPKAKVGAK